MARQARRGSARCGEAGQAREMWDEQTALWGDAVVHERPMERSAVISDDGTYRYRLTRRWGEGVPVVWVMLNPSRADAHVDDPTLKRCVGFARAWGYFAVEVCNLFAFRSTDPEGLLSARDPIGPTNDTALRRQIAVADAVGSPLLAGWGVHAPPERVNVVRSMPGAHRFECLGRTKSGAPYHPLYRPADSPRVPWP